MSSAPFESEHRTAVFGWVLSALFTGLVLVFAGLIVRDGPPRGTPPLIAWGMLAFFAAGAVSVLVQTWREPLTLVRIFPSGAITIRRRWPLRSETIERRARDVDEVDIETTTDSDGDPYHTLSLVLSDGDRVVVERGPSAQSIEATRRRLMAVLGR